jgi:hypothetical protein
MPELRSAPLSRISAAAVEAPDDLLLGLVHRLSREIEELLDHFRLDAEEAEQVLREGLLLLIYRWEVLESRELWLLATLRRLCLRCTGRRFVFRTLYYEI